MNNELTNVDKIYLRNILSNEIDKNLKSIAAYYRLENMQSLVDYLTSKNEMYQLLINKLKND